MHASKCNGGSDGAGGAKRKTRGEDSSEEHQLLAPPEPGWAGTEKEAAPAGAEEHEEEGDEEELDIALDGEGRLAGAAVGLDYRSRSWPRLFAAADAAALAEEVLVLHAQGNALDASFLLRCADTRAAPRTHAEAAAARIFALHTAGAKFDAAKSGAEWWFQVRAPDVASAGVADPRREAAGTSEARAAAPKQQQGEQEKEKEQPQGQGQAQALGRGQGQETEQQQEEEIEMRGETIMFHWDKDEVLSSAYQVMVHPQLSTVTYLSVFS